MRKWKKLLINGSPKIGIVVATFEQDAMLRGLAASLQAQTYPHFVALAIHDGPADERFRKAWPIDDERFLWEELPERHNKYGHPSRRIGFEKLSEQVEYLCNTNGDCWYAPVYFEAMLWHLQNHKASFVHCNMVHSHRLWAPMSTEIGRSKIDTGCWVADRSLVMKALPLWTSNEFAADWHLIEKMMAFRPTVVKSGGYYYVHN